MARSPTRSAEEARWRAQSDLETLTRAQEIQADRSRHGAAKKLAAASVAAMSKVAGTTTKAAPKARTTTRKGSK